MLEHQDASRLWALLQFASLPPSLIYVKRYLQHPYPAA